MNLSSFTAQYKASLLDSVRAFAEADYPRHVATALAALSSVKPQRRMAIVRLEPGRSLYLCPADLTRVHACWWGRSHKAHGRPWDDDYPGALPEWRVVTTAANERLLRCHPAPSGKQLLVLGNACEIEYHADHVLTENECSLDAEELDLLLLRAQAEAMRELSMKNATTAYQLREGISATPKNGTPAYLYQELLAEFERRLMR